MSKPQYGLVTYLIAASMARQWLILAGWTYTDSGEHWTHPRTGRTDYLIDHAFHSEAWYQRWKDVPEERRPHCNCGNRLRARKWCKHCRLPIRQATGDRRTGS